MKIWQIGTESDYTNTILSKIFFVRYIFYAKFYVKNTDF